MTFTKISDFENRKGISINFYFKNFRGIFVNFHFKNGSGISVNFYFKNWSGIFVNMLKMEKSLKNLEKIPKKF